jgi:hypothetical protein
MAGWTITTRCADRSARAAADPVDTGNARTSQPAPTARRVEVVDSRTEIRDFLTSRRAKITPERAGLPFYGGNRRVTGLRREEVALLAGVSVDYYTRLERGNLNGVSDSVLEALARALQLDEAERAHLFDLARTANTTAATAPEGPHPALTGDVTRFTQGPGRRGRDPRVQFVRVGRR